MQRRSPRHSVYYVHPPKMELVPTSMYSIRYAQLTTEKMKRSYRTMGTKASKTNVLTYLLFRSFSLCDVLLLLTTATITTSVISVAIMLTPAATPAIIMVREERSVESGSSCWVDTETMSLGALSPISLKATTVKL